MGKQKTKEKRMIRETHPRGKKWIYSILFLVISLTGINPAQAELTLGK